MSTTSFLTQLGIAKMGKIGDAIVSALVQFDPETASAAQIAEMDANCNHIAARVAKAEAQVESDKATIEQLETALSRNTQAAKILGERLQAAQTSGDDVTSLNNKLSTLLDKIEQIAGEDGTGQSAGTLFDAKQHLAESTVDLSEWRETHQRGVAQLTTARERLSKAHSAMEHAVEEKQRAEERRRQAERDAGLKSGLDTGNIALSAMEQAAQDAKRAARAATIQTDALRQSGSNSAEDIAAETLADQKPKASALDRLAKLNKETQ